MVRITFFILLSVFTFFSFTSKAENLTPQEILIFNFIDQYKDSSISITEINYIIKLIFQLIDENKDGNISEIEIKELKNIIDLLS